MSKFGISAVAALCLMTQGYAGRAGAIEQPPAVTAVSLPPGEHDFDFEIGVWKTHLVRRLHPLTGSQSWADYEGTTTVRPVWGGGANLVELVADGSAGHFEGLSLRLYNPQTRQWALNFSNRNDGLMTTPSVGGFRDGRGEFYQQDTLGGRAIFVRFIITPRSNDAIHFEQAFSADGGKTWEVNWIADDTRMPS